MHQTAAGGCGNYVFSVRQLASNCLDEEFESVHDVK